MVLLLVSRVPLRGLLVSLLSHQLLLQTLGSILLDNAESVMAHSSMLSSPSSSLESFSNEATEASLPGLLSYLSPANLSVLFDCLMESHSVAYEFNARPGLRSLIQKLAKLDAPAISCGNLPLPLLVTFTRCFRFVDIVENTFPARI